MYPEDARKDGVNDSLIDFNSTNTEDQTKRKLTPAELQELQAVPIVVIKNFTTKHGKDEVISVLSSWAATLVNNAVAHVIVVSDNRDNAKVLIQGMLNDRIKANLY